MTKAKYLRVTDYLGHIVEAITRIQEYTNDMSELGFLEAKETQGAVIRNLEIIGEASHNIESHYPKFSDLYPDLPLWKAYEMRNALAHGYFSVDLEIVWKTVERDLPELRAEVERTQQKINETPLS